MNFLPMSPTMLREYYLYRDMDETARDIHKTTGLDKKASIYASKVVRQVNAIGKGKDCIDYLHVLRIKLETGWDLDRYIDEPEQST